MTHPNTVPAVTSSNKSSPPTAPPPNPKIQAVDFAVQLAGINATTTPQEPVTADQIVSDATTIANFIESGKQVTF